jgi:hypothetical protein
LRSDFSSWSGYANESTNSSARQRLNAGRLPFGRSAAPQMTARNHNYIQTFGRSAKPVWAEVWHLWTIIIPRRSITGRLVFGQVWRRHDGRHWIYKKFIEYARDRDQ